MTLQQAISQGNLIEVRTWARTWAICSAIKASAKAFVVIRAIESGRILSDIGLPSTIFQDSIIIHAFFSVRKQ